MDTEGVIVSNMPQKGESRFCTLVSARIAKIIDRAMGRLVGYVQKCLYCFYIMEKKDK